MNLHPCRYSKLNWTRSWAKLSKFLSLGIIVYALQMAVLINMILWFYEIPNLPAVFFPLNKRRVELKTHTNTQKVTIYFVFNTLRKEEVLNLSIKYCEQSKTVRPLLIAFLFFILHSLLPKWFCKSFTFFYFFTFIELMQNDRRRLTDDLVLLRFLTDLVKLQV